MCFPKVAVQIDLSEATGQLEVEGVHTWPSQLLLMPKGTSSSECGKYQILVTNIKADIVIHYMFYEIFGQIVKY